jgi:hypothetical protein
MTFRPAIGLIAIAFICTACPYESAVPLTHRPTEAIDSSLVGYWYGIVKDGSDFFGIEALDISAKSDSVYSITRFGKSIRGDMIMPDTAFYTAFTSRVGDQRFMSVEGSVRIPSRKSPSGYEMRKIFYISSLDVKNDTLSIKTITENFTARKDFRNPDELMSLVLSLTQQQKNIFDDLYSLQYRKMERVSR